MNRLNEWFNDSHSDTTGRKLLINPHLWYTHTLKSWAVCEIILHVVHYTGNSKRRSEYGHWNNRHKWGTRGSTVPHHRLKLYPLYQENYRRTIPRNQTAEERTNTAVKTQSAICGMFDARFDCLIPHQRSWSIWKLDTHRTTPDELNSDLTDPESVKHHKQPVMILCIRDSHWD